MPSYAAIPVNINNHNVTGEVAELVDAILNDRPLEMDGKEGARTIAAGIAAIESTRTGRPVKVKRIC